MKRLFLIIAAALTLMCAAAKGNPEISFSELTHDFGNVKRDSEGVSYVFKYKNTGTAPLVLTTVSAPCNCTKTKWSPKPVQPGKTGEIKVIFTPDNNLGEFMRTISVWTNVRLENKQKKKVTLKISGTVIPSPK